MRHHFSVAAKGLVCVLESQNSLIGVDANCLADEPENTRPLVTGDRLLFYTSGLIRSVNADGVRLGQSGLVKIASDAQGDDAFETADQILDHVVGFCDGPANNDPCFVCGREFSCSSEGEAFVTRLRKGCAMRVVGSRKWVGAAASLVCTLFATDCLAGAKVTVGRTVRSDQRRSMDQVDHVVWDGLLKRYVDGSGNVDYTQWKRSKADVKALEDYLNMLSQGNMRAPAKKAATMAFWINAYNALTVHGILREYPTTSIRNHTARLIGYNIWKDLLLVVGDDSYSLEQIEHEILRKMGDPRIHFAIVCASHSCPRLLNEAYTGDTLERQLVANSRAFFVNRENFRYDSRGGTFYVSSILKWFATDFGDSSATQLRTIAPYLPDRESQQAAAKGSGRFSYLDYDWSLNDQAAARSARR